MRWLLALVVTLVVGIGAAVVWTRLRVPPASSPSPADIHGGAAAGRQERANSTASSVPERAERQASDAYRVRVLVAEQPVVGARVVLCQSSWCAAGATSSPEVHRAQTDASGVASLGSLDASFDTVVIVAARHAPHCVTREATAGVQSIALSPAPSLAGIVRVDGAVPATPLALEVTGFRDPSVQWCAAARSVVAAAGAGESRLQLMTSSGGAFAAYGLPPGESVSVSARGELRLAVPLSGNREPRVVAVTPALGLRLELVTPPRLTGRVVAVRGARERDGAVSSPFLERYASAELGLTVRFRRANRSVRVCTIGVKLGDRFAVPFVEASYAGAEIEVRASKHFPAARLLHRVVGEPLRASYDVGDLELDLGVRELQLQFVDVLGAPVAGARAAATRDCVSKKSSADGHAVLRMPRAFASILAGAFGFATARHELPEPLPAPWRIVLERANRLRVVLDRAPGAPPPRGLQVTIDGSWSADSPECYGDLAEVRGPRASSGTWEMTDMGSGPEPAGRTSLYSVGADGTFVLCDFPPNQEFGLAVDDRFGSRLLSQRLRLGAGEQRELRHVLPVPRTCRGRVVDAAGKPVPGAVVCFDDEALEPLATGEDGWFALEDLYGDPMLSFRAADHASTRVRASEAAARTIVLERARTVWVEVVDAAGERVDAEVEFRLDGMASAPAAARRSTGFYQVDGVAPRAGVVRAKHGELRGESAVVPGQTNARVVLR